MKAKSLYFVLVSMVMFCAQLWAEDAAPTKPKLKIDAPVYDFGTVTQGSKVSYDFLVRNEGNADLTIQRLVPACGCTAANTTNAPIVAGAEGKIHVDFDTNGFSGEKLKTIRVYSNDTDNPSQLLTLKGVITPDILVEPQSLFFDQVVRGSDLAQNVKEVVIKIREGVKTKIVGVKSFSKYLVVKELDSSPTTRKISVSIDPAVPLGELRDRLVVELSPASSTAEKSINIPVFALVKGNLQLKPAQLSFGVIEGAQELTRSVKLENVGPDKVLVKSVKSSDPAIQADVQIVKEGKEYTILVKVDPAKVSKDLRASLEVVTDSETEGTLLLNVYGILPPKI